MNKRHYRVKRKDDTYLHVYVMFPEKQCLLSKNIIFVHGFLGEGTENHRMFIRIAEKLSGNGFTCFLFDQYGCGYSDGDYKDIRLEDVKSDLYIITAWVKQNFGDIVGYLGQSVGSALVLSITEQLNPQFRICINPAAGFNQWLTTRYKWDLSETNNYFYAVPKGIMVSRIFIMDLLNWDWIKELKKSSIPTLLIAATDDDTYSANTSYTVQKYLGNNTNIVLLEGANHSFIGQRELEQVAIDNIVGWLEELF